MKSLLVAVLLIALGASAHADPAPVPTQPTQIASPMRCESAGGTVLDLPADFWLIPPDVRSAANRIRSRADVGAPPAEQLCFSGPLIQPSQMNIALDHFSIICRDRDRSDMGGLRRFRQLLCPKFQFPGGSDLAVLQLRFDRLHTRNFYSAS